MHWDGGSGSGGGDGPQAGPDAEGPVELVDETGKAIGSMPKLAAHAPPGTLHRAFSVFLVDGNGLVILQRRALSKYHGAGLWSNACCGHPAPGTDARLAASRRVREELGVAVPPGDLVPVGTVTYAVTDGATGLVEREFDHVFVGRAIGPLDPDPAEVAEIRSVAVGELAASGSLDLELTAWFPSVLAAALPALEELAAPRRTGTR